MGIPITLRAKRQKQTFFVSVETSDSVLNLKTKLAHMIGRPKEAKDLRLQTLAPKIEGQKTPQFNTLEDSAILEQLGLPDDAVVYFTYWISEGTDGTWESVQIIEFEPLNEDSITN